MQTKNLLYGILLAITLMVVCSIPNAAKTPYELIDENYGNDNPDTIGIITN